MICRGKPVQKVDSGNWVLGTQIAQDEKHLNFFVLDDTQLTQLPLGSGPLLQNPIFHENYAGRLPMVAELVSNQMLGSVKTKLQ